MCSARTAATEAPCAETPTPLPTSLAEGLDPLAGDSVLRIGAPLVDCFMRVKRAEAARFEQVAYKDEWRRREYFSRF